MTNEELYRQVCAGDMDAFHTLYGRLENLIRAIARDTARQFGYTDSIPAVLLEDLQAEGTLELLALPVPAGEDVPLSGDEPGRHGAQ